MILLTSPPSRPTLHDDDGTRAGWLRTAVAAVTLTAALTATVVALDASEPPSAPTAGKKYHPDGGS